MVPWNEGEGEQFGLVGWIMVLTLVLGVLAAGFAAHLESLGGFTP